MYNHRQLPIQQAFWRTDKSFKNKSMNFFKNILNNFKYILPRYFIGRNKKSQALEINLYKKTSLKLEII